MTQLTMGVLATSRKENEFRLPIHPSHFGRIDDQVRRALYFEEGYARRFGTSTADLEAASAGVMSRSELLAECDVIVLPKPQVEDLAEMKEGQVLWGWPHCVQDRALTQQAIDLRLTLIAWEAMNRWNRDGSFGLHVFHMNNELAGYCSVLHALRLIGRTGSYGPSMRAAVISFGATGRGAVTALRAMGIHDVTILSHRAPAAVESPAHAVAMGQIVRDEDDPSRPLAVVEDHTRPMVEELAAHDVVVNCVFQDPDDPQIFVRNDDLGLFRPGSLIVDVSCDEGMGFEWARPTSFEEPMFTVGDRVNYYAVDHSPSYLWDAATWEISDSLLPFLPLVGGGPEKWDADETVAKAIEIRDGVIQNPKILSFQGRSPEYPHGPI
ncbi:MAG TPA: N(5)-(carboxyethyl)ornithine synthase [Actinomycetota bacterium]|nr:N(5)-(carboxyethyl)ornithine synthase [Actinomycetota bacterium]